jgi:hypothetical protein
VDGRLEVSDELVSTMLDTHQAAQEQKRLGRLRGRR